MFRPAINPNIPVRLFILVILTLALPVSCDRYNLLGCDSTNTDSEIKEFIEHYKSFTRSFVFEILRDRKSEYKYAFVKVKRASSCSRITSIIEDLRHYDIVGYAHYTTKREECWNSNFMPADAECFGSYSHLFYVKVKDSADLSELNRILQETNAEIKSQDTYMRQWFTLSADKNSMGDALQMANYFFEPGHFMAAEPNYVQFTLE